MSYRSNRPHLIIPHAVSEFGSIPIFRTTHVLGIYNTILYPGSQKKYIIYVLESMNVVALRFYSNLV